MIALPPITTEANRSWAGSCVMHTQFKPTPETRIGDDPETGDPIPHL